VQLDTIKTKLKGSLVPALETKMRRAAFKRCFQNQLAVVQQALDCKMDREMRVQVGRCSLTL